MKRPGRGFVIPNSGKIRSRASRLQVLFLAFRQAVRRRGFVAGGFRAHRWRCLFGRRGRLAGRSGLLGLLGMRGVFGPGLRFSAFLLAGRAWITRCRCLDRVRRMRGMPGMRGRVRLASGLGVFRRLWRMVACRLRRAFRARSWVHGLFRVRLRFAAIGVIAGLDRTRSDGALRPSWTRVSAAKSLGARRYPQRARPIYRRLAWRRCRSSGNQTRRGF